MSKCLYRGEVGSIFCWIWVVVALEWTPSRVKKRPESHWTPRLTRNKQRHASFATWFCPSWRSRLIWEMVRKYLESIKHIESQSIRPFRFSQDALLRRVQEAARKLPTQIQYNTMFQAKDLENWRRFFQFFLQFWHFVWFEHSWKFFYCHWKLGLNDSIVTLRAETFLAKTCNRSGWDTTKQLNIARSKRANLMTWILKADGWTMLDYVGLVWHKCCSHFWVRTWDWAKKSKERGY